MPKTFTTSLTPYRALNIMKDDHTPWMINLEYAAKELDNLAVFCHCAAVRSGWWHDKETGDALDMNVGERISLMHSELSEMLEAERKDIKESEHIPGFSGAEEEAADLLIRLFDYAAPRGFRLKEAFMAKFLYNLEREDHKPENRSKEGGKQF